MKPAPSLASFDRAARTYLVHAGVQAAMAEWLAEWLPADRTGRALEVGAGPGVLTRRLLPWTGTLVASDRSAAMCAAGREALPQVGWRTMAAETPADGPWDWIFSSSVLQWLANPEAVFRAWRARLAPGGRVLAGFFTAGSLAEWNAVAGDTAPLVWRTPAEWRAYLTAAGFRVLRDQSEKRVFHHDSARAFLRTLHGVGAAPARRLPAARLRSLLEAYDQRHQSKNGVAATWQFYRVEAV